MKANAKLWQTRHKNV